MILAISVRMVAATSPLGCVPWGRIALTAGPAVPVTPRRVPSSCSQIRQTHASMPTTVTVMSPLSVERERIVRTVARAREPRRRPLISKRACWGCFKSKPRQASSKPTLRWTMLGRRRRNLGRSSKTRVMPRGSRRSPAPVCCRRSRRRGRWRRWSGFLCSSHRSRRKLFWTIPAVLPTIVSAMSPRSVPKAQIARIAVHVSLKMDLGWSLF
mmetsp:Transcript_58517/g.128304  ORF Transcript_58517/g.128304 Transcript_58517/m.128304 type:complete len:212 (+) Transcript_58517:1035-1670(+)